MLDAFLALLTGGATGLLGTALSFAADWFRKRQRHAQEVELRRLDMEQARIEAESAERAAALAAEGEAAAAEALALEASYAHAGRRWSLGDSRWLVAVDVVRGLMRPALTCAFVGLAGAVYFTLGAGDVDTLDLKPRVVDTVLYLATACVLWWFGTRPPAREARR